jgi:hypothetical protein
MKKLSKYQRKNMTAEEIEEYEKDIDEDGYELVESIDYEAYIIEISHNPKEVDKWKVWNDFDEQEWFTDNREHANSMIEDIKEDIQEEIDYYDEVDEDED